MLPMNVPETAAQATAELQHNLRCACHCCLIVLSSARSLYLRTFGSTNHEVKTITDGRLETICPVQGRFYRFSLSHLGDCCADDPQHVLVITELDATQSGFGTLELQLLDPGDTDACTGWGEDFPARLREMHSHWFDRCVLRKDSSRPSLHVVCSPARFSQLICDDVFPAMFATVKADARDARAFARRWCAACRACDNACWSTDCPKSI
jgi:hypothetical protein